MICRKYDEKIGRYDIATYFVKSLNFSLLHHKYLTKSVIFLLIDDLFLFINWFFNLNLLFRNILFQEQKKLLFAEVGKKVNMQRPYVMK